MKVESNAAKAAARSASKHILKSLCDDVLYMRSASAIASSYFLSSSMYKNTDTVFAYISMKDELDTMPIIRAALKDNKSIAVPRIDGSEMEFYYLDPLQPLDKQLEMGTYGILEPSAQLRKVEIRYLPGNAVFLIPGLAFTPAGERLGRGKGFFDRFIDKIYKQNTILHIPKALVGFCCSAQVLDSVPVEDHDITLTHVITEKGVMNCQQFYFEQKII